MTTIPVEQQWLTEARAGDPAALGKLLAAHQDRLYRVCLRMLGNRDDAAEVCQEAMLKIVEHISEYRGEAHLTTWMTRIAMNQSLTRLRRQKLRRTVSLDHDPRNPAQAPRHDRGASGDAVCGTSGGGTCGGGGGDQAAALRDRMAQSREPDPAQRVQMNERLQLLQRALAGLEPDFRAVLVLRDIEGMDYEQIARTLDVNPGTVKSRLFRARLALRQTMIKLEGEASGDDE